MMMEGRTETAKTVMTTARNVPPPPPNELTNNQFAMLTWCAIATVDSIQKG